MSIKTSKRKSTTIPSWDQTQSLAPKTKPFNLQTSTNPPPSNTSKEENKEAALPLQKRARRRRRNQQTKRQSQPTMTRPTKSKAL